MASEIRVDTSKNTSGLCTVTYSNTGAVLSGITTASGVIDAQGYINLAQKIIHTGDADTSIEFPSNDTIKFETAGGERLRITSNGSVGIGTNDPTWGLSGAGGLIVGNGGSSQAITIFSGTTNVGDLSFGDATSGTARYRGLIRYDHDDNSFAFRTNSNERLRITSAGKLGIGITNPNAMMQIISDQNAETNRFNSSNYHLMLQNDQNDTGEAVGLGFAISDDTDKVGGAILFERSGGGSAGDLEFYTNSDGASVTERLRITSGGNTKFWGTRSGALQANDNDNLLLYTKSTSDDINRGSGITFYNHDGSGYEMGGTIQVAKENGTTDDAKAYMRFSTQNGSTTTEALRITSAGRIGINQETPDARLHIAGTNDAIIRLESTDTGLGQDELVGAVEFEKNDASGAGAGVCGGVRCYSEDSYGARTYLAFAVRSNSTGQAATDTEICRITRHGLIFDTSVTGTDSAKALDSYEEGQYIPTVTASTSGSWTTTSYRYLAYVKIGKLVHIQGYLNINSESSPSGSVRISLPFSVDSSLSENAEYGNISVSMRSHGGSNLYNLNGAVSSNYIELVAVNGAGSHNWIGEDDIGSSWNIRIGGCFIAA